MIMVTHRSEAVEQMDRVILLASGRIAAIDSPHNLQRHSPLYRRLMNADRPNRPA
jgi:ABC-type transport system involved in cytochrome bd biosynthesis fused ATPase/permease subunit